MPHGSPTYCTSGHEGKELILNPATNDWVESKDFSVPESFTISFWMKPNNLTSNQCIIGKHDANGGNIFPIGMWVNNFEVDVRNGEYLYSMNGGSIVPGVYQHMAVEVSKVNSTKSNVIVFGMYNIEEY